MPRAEDVDVYSRTSRREAGAGAGRGPGPGPDPGQGAKARRGDRQQQSGRRRPRGTGSGGPANTASTRVRSWRDAAHATGRTVILAFLGVTAGLATLFDAYSPFGLVAVISAIVCFNPWEAMPLVAGALVGSAVGGGATAVLAMVISWAMLEAVRRPVRRSRGSWGPAVAVAAASLGGTVASQLLVGGGVSLGVFSLVQASLAAGITAVILPGLPGLSSGSPDGGATLAALALCCSGLSKITVSGASAGVIAGLYASALAGLASGPGAAALAGVASGFGVGLSRPGTGPLVAVLALGGAIAGAASRQGRVMTGAAMLGAAVTSAYYFRTSEAFTARLIEAAIAAAALMLTSERVLSAVARNLPQPMPGFDGAKVDRVHHIVCSELAPVSEALMSLARAYRGKALDYGLEPNDACADDDSVADDPASLMAAAVTVVRRRACERCPKFNVCWHKMFVRTYREFVDVLAVSELCPDADDECLPQGLSERCARPSRVVAAAHEYRRGSSACESSSATMGIGAPDGLPVSRDTVSSMLSSQLSAVSQLLNGLELQARGNVASDAALEQEISRRLAECGVGVEAVSVSRRGRAGFEVEVAQATCPHTAQCVSTVAPVVTSVLGQKVAVWEARCGCDSGAESCNMRLLPRAAFAIEVGWVSVPRNQGDPCGDTAARFDLGDGSTAIVVCDGMGVGEVAATQSQAAVERLDGLLRAGISPVYASQVVNDLMFLGADAERFTTLDLLLFNGYTGKAEIVKAGAPPSFLLRDGHVDTIGEASIPAGVAAPGKMYTTSVQLKPDDELFMVTDGLLDARSEFELGQFVAKLDAGDATEHAEAVANWVQGGVFQESRDGVGPSGKSPVSRRRGSAAVAAARIAGASKANRGDNIAVDTPPTALRDDFTIVALRIAHVDGVKV